MPPEEDLYKNLTKYQKLLLLAAAAGPLRVVAGAVRIIKNVQTARSTLLATNNSEKPLFVRISAGNIGYPVGGHFYFSIASNASTKDSFQTGFYYIPDYYNWPVAIQSPAVPYVDFILNPNEQLWARCVDAVRDLKVTSVTVD